MLRLGKRGQELLRGGRTGREREKIAEVPGEASFYVPERDAPPKQFFERRGFAVGDPAGNDELEKAQVGCNVIGKAV